VFWWAKSMIPVNGNNQASLSLRAESNRIWCLTFGWYGRFHSFNLKKQGRYWPEIKDFARKPLKRDRSASSKVRGNLNQESDGKFTVNFSKIDSRRITFIHFSERSGVYGCTKRYSGVWIITVSPLGLWNIDEVYRKWLWILLRGYDRC
jgi:hypothetical protein